MEHKEKLEEEAKQRAEKTEKAIADIQALPDDATEAVAGGDYCYNDAWEWYHACSDNYFCMSNSKEAEEPPDSCNNNESRTQCGSIAFLECGSLIA